MSDVYIVTETQKALDLQMVPYDIWGTRAHVTMLEAVGVLSNDELSKILAALVTIGQRVEAGAYEIDPGLGSQLTLEKEITAIVGAQIGGKVHTGRSRNDQVLTAQKLYNRDRLLAAECLLLDLVDGLVGLAEEHIDTVMPGYTHMQPAKPTTFGQWCLAYSDMFLRDAGRLEEAFTRHNINPLGAAESYGTSWPLDRALTADLMGFDSVQEVPLDAVASRGEMEAEIISALSFVNLHMSKLAQDLLMFNTFEFGMVGMSDEVAQRMGKVTGSSIMPQKKNPDVLELVRANTSVVYSMLFQTLEVLKALPFGYNRDSRETKETVDTAFKRSIEGIDQLKTVISTLAVDKDRMRQAVIDNYSLATDLADYLAQQFGIPYRAAYTIVGKTVDRAIAEGVKLHEVDVQVLGSLAMQDAGAAIDITQAQLAEILDPVACLSRRKHIGGAAPERMAEMILYREEKLAEHRKWVINKKEKIGISAQKLHT